MEWIKVSEKLPEIGIDVLIWDGDARSIGYFNGISFNDFTLQEHGNACRNDKVTHWQPLPEPPKGE